MVNSASIEDLKLQSGISLTSELFLLLCFVASAHFSSSIRLEDTQRPPCQSQGVELYSQAYCPCPQPRAEIKLAKENCSDMQIRGRPEFVSQPQNLCETDPGR